MNRVNSIINGQLVRGDDDGINALRIVTGALAESFPGSLAEAELGVISGAISPTPDVAAHADLFDSTVSIVDRVRGARRRAGNVKRWKAQHLRAATSVDHWLWLLSACAWASPSVFGSTVEEVIESMRELPDSARRALVGACLRASSYSKHARKQLSAAASARVLECGDADLAPMLFRRLESGSQSRWLHAEIQSGPNSSLAAELIERHVVSNILAGRREIIDDLDLLARCAAAGASSGDALGQVSPAKLRALGSDWPTAVLGRVWTMPTEVVAAAMVACNSTPRKAEPVAFVAERDHWFD